jgi:WD40 repeat protein/serine/threonine protein kinase/Tfp pilus assembly protein PilF
MNEQEIFVAALEQDPSHRTVFLDEACAGDSELRQRLATLLTAYEKAGQFMEQPAGSFDLASDWAASQVVGTMLGRYQLLEQIGEGGMGVIFRVEQHEPVHRQAALKIIKPGMDTRAVIARFEAERQSLAMMDHPNIARVLDAGTTDPADGILSNTDSGAAAETSLRQNTSIPLSSGRPYFVMELVDGLPITEFCDRNQLTIQERLELFVLVCQAVQHAHQKGIIHRDLKPSNILVSFQDGKPAPKIIDFGIAKAIHGQTAEATSHTRHGQMIGTPVYMSPEQMDASIRDVDTRSDIYSLGILLYELLTGTTPLNHDRLHGSDFAEVRRLICEEEPPRPSSRIGTLGTATATIVSHRKTDTKTLCHQLRYEIDWIVMKALRKERELRYETAGDFVKDVLRYLSNEPVAARPASTAYHLRKLAHRHRVQFIAVAAITMALIVCAVVSTCLAAWAWRAERLAYSRLLGQQAALRESRRNEGVALRERIQALDAKTLAEEARNFARQQESLASQQRDAADHALYVSNIRLAQRDWELSQTNRLYAALQHHIPKLGRPDPRGWEWYYYLSLCHGELLMLSSNGSWAISVAWSPDGQRLATGNSDGTIRVWNALTGAQILTLRGHVSRVESVAWAPDGVQLASGSFDRSVKVWNATTGKEIATFTGFEGEVFGVAWSPDGRRLVGADRIGELDSQPAGGLPAVKVWDVASGQVLLDLRDLATAPVAWSPDGQRLATGAQVWSQFRVWDVETGRQLISRSTANWELFCLDWSRDGTRIVSGGYPRGAQVWDVASGQEILQLRAGSVSSVAWCPTADKLAMGTSSQRIRVWDAVSGGEVLTLRGHRGWVRCVAWSPDGSRLASACIDDRSVRIWDASRSRDGLSLEGVGAKELAWHPRENHLAWGDGRRIVLWDAATQNEIRSWELPATHLTWSREGERLAMVIEGQVVVLDTATGEQLRVIPTEAAASFSPDATRLATASYSSRAAGVWDIATGQSLVLRRGPAEARAAAVGWSPDGARVASSGPGTITIWDASTGQDQLVLRGHTPDRHIRSLAWSPDGQRLASGGWDQTVRIWNTSTGEQLHLLSGHHGVIQRVGWSPDGSRLASSSTDSAIKIWDGANGDELLSFTGVDVAWSSDGQRLASIVDEQGTIRILDASIGYALAGSSAFEAELHASRASSLEQTGNFEGAIAEYTQMIRIRPESASAYQGRGALYSRNGEFDAAIADDDQAIRLDPTLAAAYVNRASALLEKGDFDRAAADLSKVIELTPQRASWWNWRGLAQLADGQQEEYRRDCIAMLQRFGSTEDSGIADAVARTCTLTADAVSDWSGPVTLSKKAVERRPDAVNYMITRGAVLYRAGHVQQALQWLTKAEPLVQNAGRATSPAFVWFYLAMTHHQLGHPDEAKHFLDKAVQGMEKRPPDVGDAATPDPDWIRRLTLSLLSQETQLLLTTDPSQLSETPTRRAEARYLSGRVHTDQGELVQAIAAYNEAIELDSQWADFYGERGDVHARRGDLDLAITDFNEVIRRNPNDADSWISRGSVYVDRGEFDKAGADFREAHRINSSCAREVASRAQAHRQANQAERAVAEYRKAMRLDPQYTGQFLDSREQTLPGRNRLDAMLRDFRQLLRLQPDISSAWLQWVSCWLPAATHGPDMPGIVLVSQIPWVQSTCGWGSHEARRVNPADGTLNVARLPYPNGISTIAFHDERPADVVLDLVGREFATFKAHVGLLDPAGSVTIQVLVDGQAKYDSPLMHFGLIQSLSVDVAGAKQIVLRVLNGGDGNASDSVGWGYARFVRVGAEDPLEEPAAALNSATEANVAFFLAEVLWRLDHKELAHRWYDKAPEWMKGNKSDDENLEQYRDEAAEVLGIGKEL